MATMDRSTVDDFERPEDVVRAEHLTVEQKRQILEQWRRKQGSPTTGNDGEPDLGARLGRALGFLDTETGSHETGHQQGFYTSVQDIGRTRADDAS
jgi:hypothetical protein